MKKSQLITQILLSVNASLDRPQATRLFVQEFVKHFADKNFHEWDSEVPPHIACTYLLTVDPAKEVDVKHLVQELDMLCQKMK